MTTKRCSIPSPPSPPSPPPLSPPPAKRARRGKSLALGVIVNDFAQAAEHVLKEVKELAGSAIHASDEPGRRAGRGKVKPVSSDEDQEEVTEAEAQQAEVGGRKKAKRAAARKTREEREREMIPLAPRTTGLRVFIGAHVSSAKGVHNGITNAVHIGGNAFALFLKSHRKWANPPLNDEHATLFHGLCREHNFAAQKHILPHGSYLVNLAQADPSKAAQAYAAFVDDLRRCARLGIGLYNFHPGNTNGAPRAEALARIASVLDRAHEEVPGVKTVLENMAGGANIVGGTFEDLGGIIALVRDKSRVGVCLDTCHAFAAGYDLRGPAALGATLEAFDRAVGLRFLSALHLNDSKAPLASRRDLHANVGTGFLGLRAFHAVVNEARFEGLPMVLETPVDEETVDAGTGAFVEDRGVWAREIKLLESLIGMDADGDEFKRLESELAERGREAREKMLAGRARKAEDERRRLEKGGGGRAGGPRKRKKAEKDDGRGESGSE